MKPKELCGLLCVLLCETIIVQAGRSGGGSRSRTSYSRPSASRPSYSRPSPSPSYNRPSYQSPAHNTHVSQSHAPSAPPAPRPHVPLAPLPPPIGFKPGVIPQQPSVNRPPPAGFINPGSNVPHPPSGVIRPIAPVQTKPFASSPTYHPGGHQPISPTYTKPVASAPPYQPAARPPPYPQQPVNRQPLNNVPPPSYHGYPSAPAYPPAYHPNNNYRPPPPPPPGYYGGGGGYHPQGHYGGGYHAPGGYGGGHNPGGMTIVNNYGGGGFGGGGFGGGGFGGGGFGGGYGGFGGGYGQKSGLSGTTKALIGAYVGYKVGRWVSDVGHTNHHDYGYMSYRPTSYTVHHYHHDSESIPKQTVIPANNIIYCEGNSTFCATNSMPICMNNGTIMCISFPQVLEPCKDNTTLNCIRTTVECDAKDTNCTSNSTVVDLPCISSVNITGSINTTALLLQQQAILNSTLGGNVTLVNGTLEANGTAIPQANLTAINATVPLQDLNFNLLTNTSNFCVTLVALPATKKEEEKYVADYYKSYYDDYAKNVVDQGSFWLEKALSTLWTSKKELKTQPA